MVFKVMRGCDVTKISRILSTCQFKLCYISVMAETKLVIFLLGLIFAYFFCSSFHALFDTNKSKYL